MLAPAHHQTVNIKWIFLDLFSLSSFSTTRSLHSSKLEINSSSHAHRPNFVRSPSLDSNFWVFGRLRWPKANQRGNNATNIQYIESLGAWLLVEILFSANGSKKTKFGCEAEWQHARIAGSDRFNCVAHRQCEKLTFDFWTHLFWAECIATHDYLLVHPIIRWLIKRKILIYLLLQNTPLCIASIFPAIQAIFPLFVKIKTSKFPIHTSLCTIAVCACTSACIMSANPFACENVISVATFIYSSTSSVSL